MIACPDIETCAPAFQHADPIFNLKVPASRIIGGYTIKDGVIIPNFNNSEVIEAGVSPPRRDRGDHDHAKLLSAIEPVIRLSAHAFSRWRPVSAGTPRMISAFSKKKIPVRLVDVWATGEAGAALGLKGRDCLMLLMSWSTRRTNFYCAGDPKAPGRK